MLKRLIFTVVFVAAFICFSGCGLMIGSNYIYQNGDKYTAGDREIKEKIENINIDYNSGSVKLIGSDTDIITVKETSSVKLDDKRKVHTWVDGTTLYVRYCACAKNLDLNNLQKQLIITIPDNLILSDLYVDVSSADVSCENFKSDSVDISASSGNILAECEANMIKLSASSGNVYLTQKGNSENISIETSSGCIDVDIEAATNLLTEASSGDITIKADNVKEFKSETSSGNNEFSFDSVPAMSDIEASSGNITVYLPKDSDLTVDMDPDEDDFSYDLAFTKKGDAYISGDGSNKMKIDISSGEINFRALD